jgi:glycosyltransferase involved in cell wall biosynthesis
VLASGRTGWLVPPQDPAALAEALAGALGDPAEAARRGAAARAAMISERSIDAMVRRHEDFYAAALAGAAPQRARMRGVA